MSIITPSGIQSIKTLVSSRGLSRRNRFEVDFSGLAGLSLPGVRREEIRDLTTSVNDVSIPGKQLQTFAYASYRNPVDIPTGYIHDPFIVEFVLTEDLFAKKIFDAWIDRVVPQESYLMAYPDTYKTNISLYPLDEKDTRITGFTVVEAFPKAVRDINYNSGSEEIASLQVEFSFSEILSEKIPKPFRDGSLFA
jgi:hypothetical protein